MADFVHLHLHTLYSLLDGAIRIKDLLKTVQAKGMKSVAVTDHGNLYGAVDFYKKAKEAGVKPILGMEAYVAGEKGRQDRSERVGRHLILLAKNAEGWRNLRILSSKAFTEGFYYDPRIDKPLLKQHSAGLIGLTACLGGEVPRLIRHGEMDAARNAAREYRDIFEPGAFFLEVQSNGMREQVEVNAKLAQLGRDEGIPLVATADAHYVRREDAKAHDVLMCIASNKTFSGPEAAQARHRRALHHLARRDGPRPSPASRTPSRDTAEIAEACNVELPLGKTFLPGFALPEGMSEDDFIGKLAREGLDARFREIEGKYAHDRDAYRQRLEMELGVIRKMGFSGYFLIVQDFINWAKEHEVPVGPGRGSGAGSIVAWSLRITDLDPIRWNLLFERFLNPERVSMPDFDIDFCQNRRDEVIGYVSEKYGKDNVGQIITFGSLKARSVIRDVVRVMGLPFAEGDRIAKLVPDPVQGKTPPLKECIENEPRLKDLYDRPTVISHFTDGKGEQQVVTTKDLLDIGMALEGLNRQAGLHAAGVVIADKPLWEYVPVYQGRQVRDARLAVRQGRGREGRAGEVRLPRPEDAHRHRRRAPAREAEPPRPEGLQGERHPARRPEGLRAHQPRRHRRRLPDGVVGLHRDGDQDEALAVRGRHRRGRALPARAARPEARGRPDDGRRLHRPQARPREGRLPPPRSADRPGADLRRHRLPGAGDADLAGPRGLQPRPRRPPPPRHGQEEGRGDGEGARGLPRGARARGVDEKVANGIFDLMEKFAAYGFNKSHSAAYGLLTVQTAWLKAHYPVEFMAALISSEASNTDKVVMHIAEARQDGIEVLPPDVNESGKDFSAFPPGPPRKEGQSEPPPLSPARRGRGPG